GRAPRAGAQRAARALEPRAPGGDGAPARRARPRARGRRGARWLARAGGHGPAGVPALDRRRRRHALGADGRRRGPPAGARPGAGTRRVSEALGRHAVALASVREVAARAGAARVVLLLDEGEHIEPTMVEWAEGGT